MTQQQVILALLFLLGAGLIFYFFSRRNQKGTNNSQESLTVINELKQMRRDMEQVITQQRQEDQQKLDSIHDRLFRSSNDQSTQLQGNLRQTSDMIQTLVTQFTTQFKEQSGEFQTTQKQILDFGSQLADLQNILKNPKQRGILGEYFLETVLRNSLPPESFEMQFKFKDGEIVDAAVFVKEKIVPIDSKFSLENYNRLAVENNPSEKDRLEKLFLNDLKLRIKETSKYIRPEEGTVDFAFMFIPHEAIYYDLLINKIGVVGEDTENILQRAASQYHVIVVSPTSFLAYLQTVLQGLKALKIEERAQEIRQRVMELGKHLEAYTGYFQSVGKHLSTAANQYNLASKEFGKIDKDVIRITEGKVGQQFEPVEIERPVVE
ncbi:MAG: hypothetical protein UY77_C0006G0004 [Candidatus Uhrbacteria bacterium GW2011_GWA2_53_10]|uniref:DNA recombination protein RmuC n=1 Tax=Candidatus Uhrbacteria bacterium GW2011_GWA2_53_10 TaxID=1618980 RepID=A0A0G1ZXB7_9BACT|nr:MAG: hypothetical protein UY77_C0006G0004 [Candidatus Uhrbacteria bacterium GW2011_GWA2_53_10]